MKTIKSSKPTSQRKPTTKQQPQNHQITNFRYIHKVMQEKNNTEHRYRKRNIVKVPHLSTK